MVYSYISSFFIKLYIITQDNSLIFPNLLKICYNVKKLGAYIMPLKIIRNDILQMHVDAIVNPTDVIWSWKY